jgi:hypothetical protein
MSCFRYVHIVAMLLCLQLPSLAAAQTAPPAVNVQAAKNNYNAALRAAKAGQYAVADAHIQKISSDERRELQKQHGRSADFLQQRIRNAKLETDQGARTTVGTEAEID